MPTDFSVLLLAWDDADPTVAVLGGAALPPTLPLVYQLAAQHPVLALYPHLPPTEATTALESAATGGAASKTGDAGAAGSTEVAAASLTTAGAAVAGFGAVGAAATGSDSAAAGATKATAGPLGAAANGPGVHVLPGAASAGHGGQAAAGSRLVGLDDLPSVSSSRLPTARSLMPASGAAPGAAATPAAATPAAPGRSQWPAGGGPGWAGGWAAPAAPYAGAASSEAIARPVFPPPPPAPPRPAVAIPTAPAAGVSAATAVAMATAITPTAATKLVSAVAYATADVATKVRPDTVVPAAFDEPVEEMGAAEARDLSAPEDDLVPDIALPVAPATTSEAPTAATPEPVAWAVRQPVLGGLNFRMIQYARRAAQLVAGRHDFGVIYAPNWPAWLAALEIRNRSGRPLVLYVPALPSATAPTAERGWLLGVERMALRRATLVLVPDAEVLQQLRTHHADVPGEVRIVPAADEAAVQQVLAEIARD